jgi:hypothetical protein
LRYLDGNSQRGRWHFHFFSMQSPIPFSYNHRNSGHYPSFCLLFKNKLKPIGLSVPQRKHITSRLRAQQVNAICRLVTMVRVY